MKESQIKTNFFAKSDKVKTFKAGEIIFREGEPVDVAYGIQSGVVEITVKDKVLNTVEPGGIFGEMALVDKSPRSATAIAKTDCIIVPVDEFHFNFLVQQHPTFPLFVMQVMAHRLRQMNQYLD